MKLLTLQHEMALDALGFGTVVAPLLRHYRTVPDTGRLDRRMKLGITLSHEGDADRLWSATPRDGEAGFMKPMTRISVQIQKALRCWLQLLWCGDVENLRDTSRGAQMAAYLALRPFYPRAKNAYAYDLLEKSTHKSIERSVGIYMGSVLETLSTRLRLAGEQELADYYSPEHSDSFVSNSLKSPKLLHELLAREDKLIRVWAPILGRPLNETKFELLREELARALRGVFRRDDDWRFLVPMIEIEATAGVEAYLDLPSGMRLSLKAEEEGSPRPVHSLSPAPRRVIEFPQRVRREQEPDNPWPLAA